MSIRAIDWAFRQKCKSPAQKLVLIKLADNANDEGKCWPSQGYIAEHCSMTRQTVNFHCKALAEQGLIEIVPHWIGKNRLPNTYCLRVPETTLTPCQLNTPPLSTTLTTPVDGADNPPVNGADREPSEDKPSDEPRDNTSHPADGLSPINLIELYNQTVNDNFPAVEKISDGRLKKARAYLKQFPEKSFWCDVFGEMNKSSFLAGQRGSNGHESFRASFDWLLSKGKDGTENAVKVFEGRYREE